MKNIVYHIINIYDIGDKIVKSVYHGLTMIYQICEKLVVENKYILLYNLYNLRKNKGHTKERTDYSNESFFNT